MAQKIILSVLFILLTFSLISAVKLEKKHKLLKVETNDDQDIEMEVGITSGNSLIEYVNAYRTQKGMSKLSINQTLIQDQKDLVKIFLQYPQNFGTGYGFTERESKYENKYYTEDQCMVYEITKPYEACYEQFVENPKIRMDLLREHDEAGAYCE